MPQIPRRVCEKLKFYVYLYVDMYVGKSVREYFAPGSQNPIKYVNC